MCVSAFICFGHHVGHHSCLLFNFLDHIALWIVVVAFAFALFMPAFIISTTAGKQELEKGQARDVGETQASHVLTLYRGSFRPPAATRICRRLSLTPCCCFSHGHHLGHFLSFGLDSIARINLHSVILIALLVY